MARYDMYETAPGAPIHKVAVITVTANLEDQPQQKQDLLVTFRCGFFASAYCMSGGHEEVYNNGKRTEWAASVERTCNGYRVAGDCPSPGVNA